MSSGMITLLKRSRATVPSIFSEAYLLLRTSYMNGEVIANMAELLLFVYSSPISHVYSCFMLTSVFFIHMQTYVK